METGGFGNQWAHHDFRVVLEIGIGIPRAIFAGACYGMNTALQTRAALMRRNSVTGALRWRCSAIAVCRWSSRRGTGRRYRGHIRQTMQLARWSIWRIRDLTCIADDAS